MSKYVRTDGKVFSCEQFLVDHPYPKDVYLDAETDGYVCLMRDIANNHVPISSGDWIATSDNGANIVLSDDVFGKLYTLLPD